ncbi:endonuclease domain-containing protein [Lacisediminihabitans sp. FW035]
MPPRVPLPRSLGAAPFSVRQGASAGLGRGRMLGPDLAQPQRGVRIPAGSAPSVESLCRALRLRLPPSAFFSGITAAVVINLPLPSRSEASRRLEVSVPAPLRAPTGRGIRGRSVVVRECEIRVWHGIRISSPERVFCDLGADLDLPDLVAVGDFLIGRMLPLTSRDALAAAIASYPGRRGLPVLRAAHPMLSDRSESRKESHLRVIILTARLPGMVANLPITTSGGFEYRADLAFPRHRVLIEYQSDYHSDPDNFRADITHRARLEADGWFVMQVNANDLRDPDELVARIRTVLASRG